MNRFVWAGPCKTAEAAAQEAFHLVDTEHMTVWKAPGNPKFLRSRAKQAFLDKLLARHKEKTGIAIKTR
jgi:hypothetical protein